MKHFVFHELCVFKELSPYVLCKGYRYYICVWNVVYNGIGILGTSVFFHKEPCLCIQDLFIFVVGYTTTVRYNFRIMYQELWTFKA
jgi:hypothetical protein